MIPKVQSAYMEANCKVASHGLPVARRPQQPVQEHEWWVAGTAEIAMCENNHTVVPVLKFI